jgi:hypothetical protein
MTHFDPQSEIRNPKLAAVICVLTAWMILPGHVTASEVRHADAVTVFHCTFGEDWDVNYDLWPDRWVRKTGLDYPHYVNMQIEDDADAANHKCLKIDLDGAAAAVCSPPIRVMSRFSYVFDAQLKNDGLAHSSVVLTLDFCNSSGKVLQTERSEPYSSTKGWQLVQLGPIEPHDPSVDRVVLGLQVVQGGKGDLQGHVSLADVWLARRPRIDVSTNNPCNVYKDLNSVAVRCELSGIRERDPEIHFQLLDAANNELASQNLRFNGQLIVNKADRTTELKDGGETPDGYEGVVTWQPKIPDYGFYRVMVRMLSSESSGTHTEAERELGRRTVDLAVVPPLTMPRRGEFGWTLPDGDHPLAFQDLSRLLPEVGINWVKAPVWFDASDPHRGDELIRFVELLGASNIDMVGIIDRPPTKPAAGARATRDASIADVLTQEPSVWSPSLEPVMTRLSLRVRWWQLGRDYDTGLDGLSGLSKRVEDLRTILFRFGQDVRMGLCWDWAGANTYPGKVSWDFQQLGMESQPTEAKFNELLQMPRVNSALRWVLVEPPRRVDLTQQDNSEQVFPAAFAFATARQFSVPHMVEFSFAAAQLVKAAGDARASELVRRLVSAKVQGVDTIIIPKPFNDENGLMRADGMPAELLLPWRTTAAMLGGTQYLGQMQLPGGSENRIFRRPDGQVVMVVWNHEPVREVMYFGNDVRVVDILGRTKPAEQAGRAQVIHVGPTPAFVLGLHEAITRWRMSARFEKSKVPSIYSKPHHNSLQFENFFPQGVGGSLKIVVLQEGEPGEAGNGQSAAVAGGYMPDRWTIEPPQGTFQAAAGHDTKFPFDIRLKNALFGKQPVRIDFTVEADERYEFSVYGEMEVGTEDLTLDVKSHLDKEGTLIVEQLMTNSAAHLADFKCYLRAHGQLPQRMQVYRLGPNIDRKVYRFPDGGDLVGVPMLLELEEQNGPRVLQYRFVPTAQSNESEDATKDATKPVTPSNVTPASNDQPPLAHVGS